MPCADESALLASILHGDLSREYRIDELSRCLSPGIRSGISATARACCRGAVIEGLFGVKPDALAGEMRVSPGFPADWTHASLTHPDIQLKFHPRGDDRSMDDRRRRSALRSIRLRVPATRADRVDGSQRREDGRKTRWPAGADVGGVGPSW